jgi:hypothetical protein
MVNSKFFLLSVCISIFFTACSEKNIEMKIPSVNIVRVKNQINKADGVNITSPVVICREPSPILITKSITINGETEGRTKFDNNAKIAQPVANLRILKILNFR